MSKPKLEVSEVFVLEVHYITEEARDPDYEGAVTALCDLKNGLGDDEIPRQATLSSAVRSEVTCPHCLRHMEGS